MVLVLLEAMFAMTAWKLTRLPHLLQTIFQCYFISIENQRIQLLELIWQERILFCSNTELF